MRFVDLERLQERLHAHPPNAVVFASSYYGSPVAFSCACASAGVPMALVYQALDPGSYAALVAAGVELLPLERDASGSAVRHAFRGIDRLRTAGRHVTLLIDVPSGTRMRFSFLGYDVAVAPFAATYARATGSLLLPIASRPLNPEEVATRHGQPIHPGGSAGDATQQLLNWLEQVILDDPVPYAWNASCPVLTDAACQRAVLDFLDDAVAWRTASEAREPGPRA
jgi:lauroyl/myristoyl acyltransferase